MASATPTLDELSEQFLEQQARASEDGTIQTDITGAKVYPFEDNWWLRLECGNPFNGFHIRILLGEPHFDALNTLVGFYGEDFNSFTDICSQTVSVTLDVDHSISLSQPREEAIELETKVLVNGFNAVLAEIPPMAEMQFDERDDVSQIQQTIETQAKLSTVLKRLEQSNTGAEISKVHPNSENEILVDFNHLREDCTFSIRVTLPPIDRIDSHPVSKFVRKVGCGRLDNLDGNTVYFGRIDEDDVIGEDTLFNKYGISATPCVESKEPGILSKIFK